MNYSPHCEKFTITSGTWEEVDHPNHRLRYITYAELVEADLGEWLRQQNPLGVHMSHEGRRQPLLNPFSPTTPGTPSYVLAVQGDYGSGKTHLVVMLLNRVSGWEQENPARHRVRPVYLDAADQFRELYVRLVKGMPQNVYAKIREYYADTIVLSLLVRPGFRRPAWQWLIGCFAREVRQPAPGRAR